MKEKLPIVLREAYNVEHNFIYNSWIKSGHRSRALDMVAKEIYTINQHDVITHFLARSSVIVAQEINRPESLYGYIVYQWLDGVFVCHYAYVKQYYRNIGIFKALLAAAGFQPENSAGFYTHVTKAAQNVDTKVNLIYNPYLLINPKYEVLTSQPIMPIDPPMIPDSEISFTVITENAATNISMNGNENE